MDAGKIREQIAALQKQLDDAEKAERIQAGKAGAKAAIAQIAAFKVLLNALKARDGLLSQVWHDIPAQALPREKLIAKAYDLSETETANAKALGVKAVSQLLQS
jgi:hypothetical protein